MSNIAPSYRPGRDRQNLQQSCKKPDISKLVAALAARKAEGKSAADVKANNDADAVDAKI